tara:strand:+ start:100 stop:645 length:546 start_codon:yes stop_codon:yes gene_type:complete
MKTSPDLILDVIMQIKLFNETCVSASPVTLPKAGWTRPESVEHMKFIFDSLGITKQDWLEKTGFNEAQYYRWHNPTGKVVPSGDQLFHLLSTLQISPNYFFFKIGPISIKHTIAEIAWLQNFVKSVHDMIGNESLIRENIALENNTLLKNSYKDQETLFSELQDVKALLVKLTDKLADSPP